MYFAQLGDYAPPPEHSITGWFNSFVRTRLARRPALGAAVGDLYVLVHKTFEPEFSEYAPIVEHHFFGRTPEEARSFYLAHRQTDTFLRSCDDGGRFGTTVCRTVLLPIRRL